ncbi:MAG TPA: hypothetical protein P5528_02500 [Steroidobacteraceae bacterium]|nr:hypothetical protein [Steroidobacteraceae bacterium]HRX88292.1 hypothetical protein [Steroidobacteraceae bacterium]
MNQRSAIEQVAAVPHDDDAARRARVRRTAIVLGLVALGFYLGFILLAVMKSS